MDILREFIRLSQPIFLLVGFLCYGLGVGVAKYLGVNINWEIYWLGQGWVTLTQLSALYLLAYFNEVIEGGKPNLPPLSNGRNELNSNHLLKQTSLISSATCLTAVAYLSFLLIRDYHPPGLAILIMVGAVGGALLYSAPPFRLVTSGYGELLATFGIAVLLPFLSFILQKGEMHRLVAMTTFPLFGLHLAMMISLEFPHYARDLKHNRNVLLIRLGWQKSMLIHNLLILSAFLVLSLALIFGMPFNIGIMAFLSLPVGLIQIWQMRRIADGQKPNWTLLSSIAVFLFLSTAYLLTYSYWIR